MGLVSLVKRRWQEIVHKASRSTGALAVGKDTAFANHKLVKEAADHAEESTACQPAVKRHRASRPIPSISDMQQALQQLQDTNLTAGKAHKLRQLLEYGFHHHMLACYPRQGLFLHAEPTDLQASRLELIDLMILADKAERQRPAAPPAAAVADDEFGDNDDMGYFAWDEGWTADCVMALSQPVSMAEAEATTELLACVADGHYPTWRFMMEHIRWALDRMHTLASGSLPDGDVLAALQLYSLQDKLLQQVEFDDAVDEFVADVVKHRVTNSTKSKQTAECTYLAFRELGVDLPSLRPVVLGCLIDNWGRMVDACPVAELEELVVFGENMRQPGEEADMDSYNTWVLPVLLAGLKLLRPQHNDVQERYSMETGSVKIERLRHAFAVIQRTCLMHTMATLPHVVRPLKMLRGLKAFRPQVDGLLRQLLAAEDASKGMCVKRYLMAAALMPDDA